MEQIYNLITYHTDKSNREQEAENRLTTSTARQIIHHSGALPLVLKMAETGCRCTIVDGKIVVDTESPLPDDIQQKYLKLLVDKSLATPKEDHKPEKKEAPDFFGSLDLELKSEAEQEKEDEKTRFIDKLEKPISEPELDEPF